MPIITEESTKLNLGLPSRPVTKKMEIFYNPAMKSNRNISILVLNSIPNIKLDLALPLAGSGIRALRFLQELKPGKINTLHANDIKDNFISSVKANLKLNRLNPTNLYLHNEDASTFLLNSDTADFYGYFDYIDIDPFGSPNPFLASSLARLKNGGVLAVTATDTAALTGTYPKVTPRKYWSTSLKNYLMHEQGLRILISKVQLQGVQFDKALVPILSYSKDHYFRIYFSCHPGKENCDELISLHKYLLFNSATLEFKLSNYNLKPGFKFIGPLWTGQLADKDLLKTMIPQNKFAEESKFLELLLEENKLDSFGFYDLQALARNYKVEVTRMDLALTKLKGVRTHFCPTGLKTRKSFNEVLSVLGINK